MCSAINDSCRSARRACGVARTRAERDRLRAPRSTDTSRKSVQVSDALKQPDDSRGITMGFEKGVVGLPDQAAAVEVSRFRKSGIGMATGSQDSQPAQFLLCHTKLESAVRYLRIEVDDALNIAEQGELQPSTTGIRWSLTRHMQSRFRNRERQLSSGHGSSLTGVDCIQAPWATRHAIPSNAIDQVGFEGVG